MALYLSWTSSCSGSLSFLCVLSEFGSSMLTLVNLWLLIPYEKNPEHKDSCASFDLNNLRVLQNVSVESSGSRVYLRYDCHLQWMVIKCRFNLEFWIVHRLTLTSEVSMNSHLTIDPFDSWHFHLLSNRENNRISENPMEVPVDILRNGNGNLSDHIVTAKKKTKPVMSAKKESESADKSVWRNSHTTPWKGTT